MDECPAPYLQSGEGSSDPVQLQLHEPGILHPLPAHHLCQSMAVEVEALEGKVA